MTACRACAPFGVCVCNRRALVELLDAPRPIEPQADDEPLYVPEQRTGS